MTTTSGTPTTSATANPAPSTRPNPVAKAAACPIGQQLNSMRNGSNGVNIGRKDLKRILAAGDGISLMHQAPKSSSETITSLQQMIRMVPTTRRQPSTVLNVGDRAPDFVLTGSHGRTVASGDLIGRKPFAMRLTRTQNVGIVCPACIPGLDDLTRTHEEFEALGAELLVVFPVKPEQATAVVDELGLPYPVYADNDWILFNQYETRFSAGPPLPAWVVVDVDGIIRYLWRATEGGLYDTYPEGPEILAQLAPLSVGS